MYISEAVNCFLGIWYGWMKGTVASGSLVMDDFPKDEDGTGGFVRKEGGGGSRI